MSANLIELDSQATTPPTEYGEIEGLLANLNINYNNHKNLNFLYIMKNLTTSPVAA